MRQHSRTWLATILTASIGASLLFTYACGSDKAKNCTSGDEGCSCFANDTCNEGLTCASSLCVSLADGSGGAGGSGGADETSQTGGAGADVSSDAGGASTSGAGATSTPGAGGTTQTYSTVLPSGQHVLTFGERADATFQGVTADTQLSADDSTTTVNEAPLNYGTGWAFGSDGNSSGDATRTPLLRFDVQALNPDWTIVSATLYLWTLADSGCALEGSNNTVQIFRVLETWDEGEGDGETGMLGAASWNERTEGVTWTTSGAEPPSRSTTIEAEFRPTELDTEYAISLPTTLVASWAEVPANNHGLALRVAPVSEDGVLFRTRDYSDLLRRPLLSVVVNVP